jgi:hypothetical protein
VLLGVTLVVAGFVPSVAARVQAAPANTTPPSITIPPIVGATAPAVITRNTQRITLRFHVIACDGRTVRGALVYATPTPFQQFAGVERATGADGWATLTMTRQRSFPATAQQQNLVVFVRARKPGEDLLGGISSRRLMSFRVRL